MGTSWENTRQALKDFADILKCGKCGHKPAAATRYTTCEHVFCQQCISNDAKCAVCGIPTEPIEKFPDFMVPNLADCLDAIADIVEERHLWYTEKDRQQLQTPETKNAKLHEKSSSSIHYLPKRDINKRNHKGETVLHIACVKGKEDYVRQLLAAGANTNTKDNAGWSPLQEVVTLGYSNICRLLLEAGAQPNIPGIDNRTPLHEAASFNRLEEAKMLLQYSANTNVYDQFGKKPIDYCNTDEMRKLLKVVCKDEPHNFDESNLDLTVDKSFSIAQSQFIVFPSYLKKENEELLHKVALKHKMKITPTFRPMVTHVIVEANKKNTVNLSYDVMLALLRGNWLLSTEWISMCWELDDISELDLSLFEISGSPVSGIPRKARENAENQKPGLFNRCRFYFALQTKNTYYVGDMELKKDGLIRLVTEADGTILTREPNPEDINDQQLIPFHTAHDTSHPLYKCTHYIIYMPDKDEPRIKYNMPHIKSLPLIWLIECIEKFTLIDPSHLGLI